MSEYIEREKAISTIRGIYCEGCDNHHGVMCRACAIDDAIAVLADIPKADVEPVRHGIELNARTTTDVIKALRCTATAGVHGNCDSCPYWTQEELPKELWEAFGATYTECCDVDRVAMDAANLLEEVLQSGSR